MFYSKNIHLSLALCLSSSLALANDVRLDEVEVTSNSLMGGVDENKIAVRNASLLKDVLRDIPGVYVGGTNGANQKIYMRGISDRGLNITIDGARQTGNTFHHNADLLIDPDIIKAVDVDVGGLSVVNSTGSLGGSVAFKTVDAKDLLEDGQSVGAKLKTGYASNNKQFSKGGLIYANAAGFDGLFGFKHQSYKRGKSGNDKSIGGKGKDINYLIKAGYSFLDANKISFSSEKQEFKGLYPLRAEFGATDNLTDTKYQRTTHTIKYEYDPSDLLKLTFSGYVTEHFRKSNETKWGVKTKGLDIKGESKFDTLDQILKYGLVYYHSSNYAKPITKFKEHLDTGALYVEDTIKVSNLSLRPGLRFEKSRLKSFGDDNASKHYSFSALTPAFGLDYKFGSSGVDVFANYARVFKAPDVGESLYASGNVRGSIEYATNDDLKATTGNSYELGIRYKASISEQIGLSMSAKYYDTRYKNLIYDNYRDSNGRMMRKNAGGANVNGVELSTRLELENLSLSASYTHQKTKYKDRLLNEARTKTNGVNTYYTPSILGYRDQGDKYTFNAEYSFDSMDLLLGYNFLYFASNKTKSAGSDESVDMPSYSVSDIYATYAPLSGKLKGLEINFGIYNVFDKAYASHSQRVAQYTGDLNNIDWESGRNIKLNLSYKF